MKKFIVSFGIVLGLFFVGMVLTFAFPQIGIIFGSVIFVVSGFAIFKPLPKLRLSHRLFNGSIAFFVGLLTLLFSWVLGMSYEATRLVELRETDPEAYLTEIKASSETKWLAELKELAPDHYTIEVARIKEETAKRAFEEQEAMAAREAEQRQVEAERRLAEEKAEQERQAALEAERATELRSYVEQLDREILSIPDVDVSKYTQDVSSINVGLILIGTWGLLYEQGASLDLGEEAQRKRQQFRQLLVRKQSRMLPAMRDAYGPAMRQQLWEADGSARTIGAGYRTVEFVSGAFARNANIKQIHSEVAENLMMLRFTRAQYKWIKQASEFSYYTLEVPRDTDVVIWENGGRFRVLE